MKNYPVRIDYIFNPEWEKPYRLQTPIVYYSERYNKFVTCQIGMESDGASGPAEDIASISWLIHDSLCGRGTWDDGTPCTGFQRSQVLHDILLEEKRWIRAKRWRFWTGAWELVKDLTGKNKVDKKCGFWQS